MTGHQEALISLELAYLTATSESLGSFQESSVVILHIVLCQVIPRAEAVPLLSLRQRSHFF